MSLSTEGFRPGANSLRVDVTNVNKSSALPSGGGTVEVINSSATLVVYCFVGVGAQVAALPADQAIGFGFAVAPLGTKRVRCNPLADTIGLISTAAGPSTVFVSRGDGGT